MPLLIKLLIQKINYYKFNKQITDLTDAALYKLIHYDWPGNLHELEDVIERAVCFVRQGQITDEHIVFNHEYPNESFQFCSAAPGKLKDVLAETEYKILKEAAKKYGTSRQIGKILGISHTTVLKRMRKYKLQDMLAQNKY